MFVAMITAQASAFQITGALPLKALAGGIRTAFTVGGVLSVFAIAASFFVRKPLEQPAGHKGA